MFSGEVVSIATPKPPYVLGASRVTLQVDRRWRGEIGDTIEVIVGMGRDVQLAPGGKYVIYASTPGIQGLTPHRTKPFDDAREDLEYFERADRETSGGVVLGTVRTGDEATQPAAGFRVVMGNSDGEWTATTDADGIFRFTRIPAGRYGIMIDVPDGYRAMGPRVIDIPDPRACAQPQFRLNAQASVDLHVLDDAGRPAVRRTLELIDADTLAAEKPLVRTSGTYADGSVGWGNVRAGRRYIIGLNVTQVPDPKRPQPILFYPGVTDIASAHTFNVSGGEKIALDTLRLPKPPPVVHVIGTVARPDGTPLRLADIVLRSAARLSRGKQVGARVRTDAQGRFSIAGVAGYRYYVEVSLSVEGQNPKLYAVSEEFALTAKTPPLHIVRGAK